MARTRKTAPAAEAPAVVVEKKTRSRKAKQAQTEEAAAVVEPAAAPTKRASSGRKRTPSCIWTKQNFRPIDSFTEWDSTAYQTEIERLRSLGRETQVKGKRLFSLMKEVRRSLEDGMLGTTAASTTATQGDAVVAATAVAEGTDATGDVPASTTDSTVVAPTNIQDFSQQILSLFPKEEAIC